MKTNDEKLQVQGWFQGPPTMGPPYGKLPILFPYHSHVRIPKDMGPMVWEAYHKRGPIGGGPWKIPLQVGWLLGSPFGSPNSVNFFFKKLRRQGDMEINT